MKVVALISGGKDSCYTMMKCIQYGHEIVALANLLPADDAVDELDSHMYQTVGHQIVTSYAECMGVPLFRKRIQGTTRHQKLSYRMTPGDEVEDMFILLSEIKRQIPSVTAVSSGAIASDYQRLRVESVCSRLGLVSLAYLWKQNQALLLHEMITNGIVAITVKVAAVGLDPSKHLGKEMAYLEPFLHELKELYRINVCGEGGEYETLTLDCPLFMNARIVLDDFQVVLHSSEAISSVGVLHPLAFHLEHKANFSCRDETFVHEVHDGCLLNSEAKSESVHVVPDLVVATEYKLQISMSKQDDTFSLCCWLSNSCNTSTGLRDDLNAVLTNIELELHNYGHGWEDVLYIHLYIDDINHFSMANETYVRYITQDKCRFGVPSRSTIELPLLQAGLGRAYLEVLVARDQSKRVLHVQSISCWAPSCIGPYSQATLHKEILLMAGQLGLDPPTMALCNGGPTAELELALKNCEAVAKSFGCSISTSAILYVIYCSKNIHSSERQHIQEKQDKLLKQMKLLHLNKIQEKRDKLLKQMKLLHTKRDHIQAKQDKLLKQWKLLHLNNPIFLYLLVPDLPKGALVEVKPILHVPIDDCVIETTTRTAQISCTQLNHWGFQHEEWHDSCIQKCNKVGQIFAAVLCISKELVPKICSDNEAPERKNEDHPDRLKEQMERIARFCIYLLDRVLTVNGFSWNNAKNVRIYFPTNLCILLESLSLIFNNAFHELAEMNQKFTITKDPIFNLVPVLGAGSSVTAMDDIITCEVFARKS